MAFQFFVVPARDDGSAAEELNKFLASHRVLAVDRRWVEQGTESFWSFCVDYLDSSQARSSVDGSKRRSIDYKEVLSPEDFTVFAQLRELRKELSQAEGIPIYTVFTNEQLAKMVQGGAKTKADLGKINGVGDARIEKYGEHFIKILAAAGGDADETDRAPV